MNPSIDSAAAADAPDALEAQWRAAERDAAAALVALSTRMFIDPRLHDGMRSSPAFQQWRACRARAEQLRERLDARQGVPEFAA